MNFDNNDPGWTKSLSPCYVCGVDELYYRVYFDRIDEPPGRVYSCRSCGNQDKHMIVGDSYLEGPGI